MNKILVIEDDLILREELCKLLKKYSYEVDVLDDFYNFIDKIDSSYNVILLDINLPKTSGFLICKKIKEKINIPIIFVTSRVSDEDELKSILCGGDDFIRKPYNISVLIEKIRRAINKQNPENYKEIVINDVKLDLYDSTLSFGDEKVELSKNEFRIMYFMFTNKDRDINKEELIEFLWNNMMYIDENALNVNINRLRKKLSQIGVKDLIKTIHGKGYRI